MAALAGRREKRIAGTLPVFLMMACAKAAPPAATPPAEPRLVEEPTFAQQKSECDRGVAQSCVSAASAILRKEKDAPKNVEVAHLLYTRACDDLRDASSCGQLAFAYRRRAFPDDGEPPPHVRYADKACTLSNAECGLYGAILFFGDGVPTDRERGRTLLETACERGEEGSCGELRTLLANGEIEARAGRDVVYYYDKVCPRGFEGLCPCRPWVESVRRKISVSEPEKAGPLPVSLQKVKLLVGEREIHLPPKLTIAMAERHIDKLKVSIRFCLSPEGAVTCVQPVQRSGVASAEATLISAMKDWKFSRYELNGQAVPVCTVYSYSYVIEG
jgi:hypothetical protein